jgi:membrane fusion protein (multidrug efflux system)
VPTESIIPVLNGQKVYVVRKGTVIEVPVQMGLRTEDDVQVIGELQKGDEVLISGLLAVRPGMPVKTKINSK